MQTVSPRQQIQDLLLGLVAFQYFISGVIPGRSARDLLSVDTPIRQLPSTKVKGKAEEVEVFKVVY